VTDQAALDAALAHVDAELDQSIKRLTDWLSIPSISTDPAYAEHCRAAADWLTGELSAMGFDAATNPTDGHPVITAHDRSTAGPTALFYGHYDVQPTDPLELWDHDPFEPFIETRADGTRCIRARGACDDKGQVMTFVEACRAWKATTGSLPIGLTLLIEGEEESGGKHLPPFMEAHKDTLKADIGLICDTSMWDRETPAVTTMLRGMCGDEIVITAADRDLHSGFFGSAAANPNRVLARILASLHDDTGRVTIPGFYDGVPELPQSLRDQWQSLDFDPEAFLGQVGLSKPAGEQGRSVLEMIWSRPTCEINGMGGGYQGAGFKTVIPSQASAKISFRLVFDQDPHAIRAAFREHVRGLLPADCTVEFIQHGSGRAVTFDTTAPAFEATRAALSAEWGREASFIGAGGSIPINHEFKGILGMDVVLVGFGLDDDRIHSPNEKYEMSSFHKGIRSWVRILAALAAA
jgi:acetylornithine deacetylase/succinyl-diaminopimelate desuccinylase-like protein